MMIHNERRQTQATDDAQHPGIRREVKLTISIGVCDYFIRCVLSILWGVLYYGFL